MAVLFNYRYPPPLILQPNQCPRGTLIADQRRACAARPKGKYSRGRMALAPIRTREFSLPRGTHAAHPAAFQPYQPDFHGNQAGSLFIS